ncbi:MAG TPA: DUF4375 domain-containing protein [Chloroflexota bacterium]|nr:DUF4375 domain-containing protein [Chloroflexota bacterium]
MTGAEARPGETYWQAIEPIWETISIYDGPEVFLQQLQSVDRELGLLFAMHWCTSEVRNGGFHQFFHNPTGVLAPEALDGFKTVGLPKFAALLEQAMSFFGPSYPRDRAERMALLDSYAEKDPTPNEPHLEGWNPFRGLDDQFFQALHSDNGGFERRADDFARRLSK